MCGPAIGADAYPCVGVVCGSLHSAANLGRSVDMAPPVLPSPGSCSRMLRPGTGGGSARSSVSRRWVGAQWGPSGGRYTNSSSEDSTARATYHNKHSHLISLCLEGGEMSHFCVCSGVAPAVQGSRRRGRAIAPGPGHSPPPPVTRHSSSDDDRPPLNDTHGSISHLHVYQSQSSKCEACYGWVSDEMS